jgi:hypothetical protein
MDTLRIINKAKQFTLDLSVEDNKVFSASVTYDEPVALSDFILCAAVTRDTGGCGSILPKITKIVQRK